MAQCSICGKDVGCGCNLTSGKCHSCVAATPEERTVLKKNKQRIIYNNKKIKDPPPNTEFEVILKTKGLSKQEKIKRINDILEKAREQI